MSGAQSVLLRPRPYAKSSGSLLLLPLLPQRKPLKSLPCEIWAAIFARALEYGSYTETARSLLRVCKAFQEIALPLIYANVKICELPTLDKFQQRLHSADQKWDSIRRIPYSTPGRWVKTFDISKLAFSRSQALEVDSLLTNLFPLLPFLEHFSVNPAFTLSRRALSSLADREGTARLRSLEGLSYPSSPLWPPGQDPFVRLLCRCINLEQIELIGEGPDATDAHFFTEEELLPDLFVPLHLPKLHTISICSMHNSPPLAALLFSPLPSLRKLTITPYEDIPYPDSLVARFVTTHGEKLRSLLLFTPNVWPSRFHPSSSSLLETCPTLRHLSLENPLPNLILSDVHPLQILSIPRPNDDFWRSLEKALPRLPRFCALRIRDVRWLRKGLNTRAQEAGVQGEMKEWSRRLARRRIRLLDADWNEPPS